ncbi:hypothetical protein [Maridesulfovibrio ferrireducens]|uniref:hypothetical protein n=1 Tax=Maridesulfovibrio ferrireducens TaxID=246191 RepID=UPI001A34862A|nr:hypothetical protein [Maridesulfovibrio ferrireducens]MBI9110145.1 hypothetical protein [Maridesulfovibrio ferrireducens]
MWKTIIIIITTIILIGLTTASIQAAERYAGKELTIRLDTEKNNSRNTSRLTNNSKVTNSFNISEGVSAGFIFGLDSNIPENSQSYTPEKQGFGLGLGFSFSF